MTGFVSFFSYTWNPVLKKERKKKIVDTVLKNVKYIWFKPLTVFFLHGWENYAFLNLRKGRHLCMFESIHWCIHRIYFISLSLHKHCTGNKAEICLKTKNNKTKSQINKPSPHCPSTIKPSRKKCFGIEIHI